MDSVKLDLGGVMMSSRVAGLCLACVLLITGCAENRLLMPTPNLYADEDATLFEVLPQEYASTLVELIYVTDRAPETDEAGNLRYGYNRSNSLAVGTTVVKCTVRDAAGREDTGSCEVEVTRRLLSNREELVTHEIEISHHDVMRTLL